VRTAVLGHVEWAEVLRVPRLPSAGGWVEAEDIHTEPAGGGGIGACQMAKLAGSTTFFTSLASDEIGARARAGFERAGVRVEAATHAPPQRRALISIDQSGERTITVVGQKVCARASDALPWEELDHADAVALYCADADAVKLARRARVLVATARWWPTIAQSGVQVDALVGSTNDPDEARYMERPEPAPHLVVMTSGSTGGTYSVGGKPPVRFAPAELPGPPVDSYGCGDSFLAALAYALGCGQEIEGSIHLAATAGAAVAAGRGALTAQIRQEQASDLIGRSAPAST
jgi:ribokinase